MTKIGANWAFGIDISIPGAMIMSAVTSILGDASKAFLPFYLKQLDFTLSTDEIDVGALDQLAWSGVRQLPKGIALTAKAQFNPDSKNIIWKIIRTVMPGEFTVQLAFDGNVFTLSLMLPDLTFSSRAILTGSKLSVGGQINPPKFFVGIESTLKTMLGQDQILFKAAAAIDVTQVKFSFALNMVGTWFGAFGYKKLAIGDLAGEVGLTAVAPFISSLLLGGSITFGDRGAADVISGKMYFQFNLVDPLQNYFYGNMQRLTVGQFLKHVFGKTCGPVLGESGFNNGLLISLASVAQTTPAGDKVPAGFYLKGGMNLFGLGGDAEIAFSGAQNKISVALYPFKIGMITMARSGTELTKGPMFNIDFNMEPFSFTGSMEGYLKLAIFEFYAKIAVGESSFEATVKAPFMIIFDASITVKATWSKKITECSSSFEAKLETGQAKQAIITASQSMLEAANRGFNAAQADLASAKKAVMDKAESVRLDCMKKCGFSCLMELGTELNQLSLIEVKDHSVFDISLEEYARLQAYQDIADMASLPQEALENLGVFMDEASTNYLIAHSGVDQQIAQLAHSKISYLEVDEFISGPVAFLQLQEMAMMGSEEAHAKFLEVAHEAHAKLGWGIPKISLPKFSLPKINVVSAVVSVGKAAVTAVSTAASKVTEVTINAAKAAGKAACEVAKKTCTGGCDLAKGAIQIGGTAVDLASGLVNVAKGATAGLLNLINTMLTNFDLAASISGGLSKEGFNFATKFALKFGPNSINFEVNIDFQTAKLGEMIAMIWLKVKEYFLSKVAGLAKMIGV